MKPFASHGMALPAHASLLGAGLLPLLGAGLLPLLGAGLLSLPGAVSPALLGGLLLLLRPARR
jgi:hypothetical protein